MTTIISAPPAQAATGRGGRPVTHALALVGEGIGASLSPAMHEQEGREQGLAVTYRIIDSLVTGLGPQDLPEVLRWARTFGLTGFNVTHPFKQRIMPHLDELSDRAAAIGAVNTVVLRDGRAIGHNTDWCGYARPFLQAFPEAVGRRAVLVGAGGAGTAVAYALLDSGVGHLSIFDTRTAARDAVVERMQGIFGADRVVAGEDLPAALAAADGLVNATPVGMATHPGMAVPAELIDPRLWVSEIIYFPEETELLKVARAKGCRTLDGTGMVVEQAVEAFRLFTGCEPDAARMHAHLRSMLGR